MECVFNSGSQPCAAGSREKAIGHANYVGSGLETSKLAIVILALVAGQPVDEKSHCRRLAPLVMLMAAIAGICHFPQGG